MIINYNEQAIQLCYNYSESPVNFQNSIILKAEGSSKGKEYYHVEQQAQMYLIKNAMDKIKKKDSKLIKIVRIRQEKVESSKEEGVEIVLSGKAVFEKN